MKTLDIIKNKNLIKLKKVSINWIINNSYSPKTIRDNKKKINNCKTIDELEEISKDIHKEYIQAYISGDDGTLHWHLKNIIKLNYYYEF